MQYSHLAFSVTTLIASSLLPHSVLANSGNEAREPEDENTETIMVLGKRQGSYTIITEDAEKLVKMPGAFGDPLGAITALPGVISPSSGDAPAVRGSSPEDNLYEVDGMRAGYIFHQFNTSIIDENIIQDFDLYPAGFSAQYANATGAVFDIRLRDPLKQNFKTTVTASMLRSGVMLESQVTENSAFYLSARLGMLQFFLDEEDEPDEDGFRIKSPPKDSDYVFKWLWDNDDNQRFSINLMGATDGGEAEFTETSELAAENPDFAGDAEVDDSFDSQSAIWNYRFDNETTLNVLLSHYYDDEHVSWGGDNNYFSDLSSDDYQIKAEFLFPITDNHYLNIGSKFDDIEYTYSVRSPFFVCTEFDVDCNDNRRDIIEEEFKIKVQQQMLYLIDQWQITETLSLESGLQWHDNDYTGESITHPRLALTWELSDGLRLKSSAGSYDRLPDVELTLRDIGNPDLKSYRADHITFGFEGEFSENWNFNIELYQKDFTELPLGLGENAPDADKIYVNETSGEAKGIDIFLNRSLTDRWYGWVALSYSESTRTNERTGETNDYTFDTPLVLNIVGNYQFNDNWNGGFRFTAKSGEAITKITGVRENPNFPGNYLPVYGEAFEDRLPIYARLDLRAERKVHWFGNEGSFFIDIINALNRENVTEITLDYDKVRETGELHTEEVGDIEAFFSVGVSFSF